jgi:glycosyltransferase involved in cell wall biosynthesis
MQKQINACSMCYYFGMRGEYMVHIIIATYNGEKYISEQIESILSQTYTDYVIYINDVNSSDNTVAIAKQYQKKYPDKIKINVNAVGSGGAKHNFWLLVQNASECDYMMFCDQDDVWLEDKVAFSIDAMQKAEDQYGRETPVLFNTDLIIVDSELKVIHKSFKKAHNVNHYKTKLNQIVSQNTVTGCTMVINQALIKLLTHKPKYFVMHDWWIELVAAAFGKIIYSDKKTILYRQHGKNVVGVRNMYNPLYCVKFFIFDFKTIRQALQNSYIQAESLLEIYHEKLTEQQKIMLTEYVNIRHYNKVKRIRTLFKYDFLKNGFTRKIAHLLFV